MLNDVISFPTLVSRFMISSVSLLIVIKGIQPPPPPPTPPLQHTKQQRQQNNNNNTIIHKLLNVIDKIIILDVIERQRSGHQHVSRYIIFIFDKNVTTIFVMCSLQTRSRHVVYVNTQPGSMSLYRIDKYGSMSVMQLPITTAQIKVHTINVSINTNHLICKQHSLQRQYNHRGIIMLFWLHFAKYHTYRIWLTFTDVLIV